MFNLETTNNSIPQLRNNTHRMKFIAIKLPTQQSQKAETESLTPIKVASKKKLIFKRELKNIIKSKLNKYSILSIQNIQQSSSVLFQKNKNIKVQKQIQITSKFQKFLSLQSDPINCPVCKLDIIEIAQTYCGHSFCLQCLQKSLITANRCPICREPIIGDDYGINFNKNNSNITKIINKSQNSLQYQTRLKEYIKWKETRFLTEADILKNPQLKLDVWNIEKNRWYSAKVLQIYLSQNQKISEILVQYQTISQKQIFQFNSLLIAKHGFYSGAIEQSRQLQITYQPFQPNPFVLSSNYPNIFSSISSLPFPIRRRLNRGLTDSVEVGPQQRIIPIALNQNISLNTFQSAFQNVRQNVRLDADQQIPARFPEHSLSQNFQNLIPDIIVPQANTDIPDNSYLINLNPSQTSATNQNPSPQRQNEFSFLNFFSDQL